ncbi:tonB-system energizer ExbB [Reyranella sp. CPCC 100927]|uniref:tonB-system energizer ExbB n=1 Tax=Reyranella sp. CPCC 100927 TaxID=2599616 RepID=UPI0011B6B823|nr:tonB-system energizer ExbB [Reyranella sp. CPCC 100927]TWS96621.1 tonB-system energizer ExbB [Reyranella sp. CPCC 100927]
MHVAALMTSDRVRRLRLKAGGAALALLGFVYAAAAWAQEATPPGPTPTPTPAPVDVAPAVVPKLPVDLSPWGMFQNADIVVKAVMIGLAFASIVTWTVWLAKSLELWSASRRARRAMAALEEAPTLAEATLKVGADRATVPVLVRAASAEVRASADMMADGVKERVVSRLERIEAAAGRAMTRGTGLLATIGSTAPFVGLFGTVWGIMNSFIGISKAQTTNLAVVAPGIAEALLATAIGLVAAIPAVVIYNVFARAIAGYRMQLADASAAILRLVSRDLDRGSLPLSKAAE